IGGTGDDVLTGGVGKDTLEGGIGADRFVFMSPGESPLGAGRDVIVDWEAGDRIDLSQVDAVVSQAGDQDFTFLGMTAATNTVGSGMIRAYHYKGDTYVVGGVGGNTAADFQIEIAGLHTLTSDNFVGLSRAVLSGTAMADTLSGTAGN